MRARVRGLLLGSAVALAGTMAMASVSSVQGAPTASASLAFDVATDPADGETGIGVMHVSDGLDAHGLGISDMELFFGPTPDVPFSGLFGQTIDTLRDITHPDIDDYVDGPYAAPTELTDLAPGVHALVLVASEPGDAVPTGVSCFERSGLGLVRLDISSTPDPRLVTLELRPGDAVECTYELDVAPAPGSLTVSTVSSDPGASGELDFLAFPGSLVDLPEALLDSFPVLPGLDAAAPGTFELGVGDSHTLETLPPVPHTVVLTGLSPGLEVEAIECTGIPEQPVAITGTGPYDELRVALVGITSANDVTCTFTLVSGKTGAHTTNEDVFPPKPGRWRTTNAASAISCGGLTTPLPKETDDGKIAVKKGGTRIIATGLGDGARIVLDQVPGKPGLYRGTVKAKSQGVTMPLKYEMQVVDPERIEGMLKANFKAGGQKCTLSRDFSVNYLGR